MDLRRKISINVTKHLISQKNPKYDGYQHGTASKFCKFFDKNFSGGGTLSNEQLAEELRE